jgi:SAM-dependent methyltransferase
MNNGDANVKVGGDSSVVKSGDIHSLSGLSSRQMSDQEFMRAADGTHIYGDAFTATEIEGWYSDESEGYAGLFETQVNKDYPYFAVNELHGWSQLPRARVFKNVLGLGAAHGNELRPLQGRAEHVTVLEPTDAFNRDMIYGVPASYVHPGTNGAMPFEDGAFDLITCFGVLHHIANVSFVIKEMGRVTRTGGWMLVREPVVSMGDWRHPRMGLTKRERGIPPQLLDQRIKEAGFEIRRFSWCFTPLFLRTIGKLVSKPLNSPTMSRLDGFTARLLAFNHRYHAQNWWQKIRPACAFVVAQKV